MPTANPSAISICIPVYNAEKFIGQAIDSVLAQTFADFELLILDNASTDRTLEIVNRYNDARLRVIRNATNLGMAGNFNKALAEARSPFIKILPADDIIYPLCLERQINAFRDPANASVVLVSCGRDIVDEKGKKILSRSFNGSRGKMNGMQAIRAIIQSGTNPLGEPGAVLFKASILEHTGGFDGSHPYVIDVDMWIRMLLQGDLFVIPEKLCTLRLSGNSWSVSNARIQSRDYKDMIARLSTDPRYRLSRWDQFLDKSKCELLCMLRQMLYLLVLRR